MKAFQVVACLLPLVAGAAHAQDDRTVLSPDGRVEFRLFTTLPDGAQLNSLAYQVNVGGKRMIDTSCMGLNIHFDEPLLGENVGLSAARPLQGEGYRGLFADYLQNSTTGRRIDVEVRVYNDGVAFRYILPKQFPLLNLLIEDDTTEFHFAYPGGRPSESPVPYAEAVPGGGWLGIFENRPPDFPAMSLVKSAPDLMTAHLPDRPHDPAVAYAGVTPWTGPWRIIALAATREGLAQSGVVRGVR